MSKAIYRPDGKAGEYASWGCNLYVGCGNGCDYCYLKKGFLAAVMGGREVSLKKCFKNKEDAFATFVAELWPKADRIRNEGGLFFSFSTDPCLPETVELTMTCVAFATGMNVPCHILTKRPDVLLGDGGVLDLPASARNLLSVGVTLTGCDDLEPGACPNAGRISAMGALHDAGFRTFASIEPVLDFDRAMDVIRSSVNHCDHYKIGLLSGRHPYADALYRSPDFVARLKGFVNYANDYLTAFKKPVYWKRSVRKALGEDIKAPCLVDSRYDVITGIRIVERDDDGNLSWDRLEALSKDACGEFSLVSDEATPAIRKVMTRFQEGGPRFQGARPVGVVEFLREGDIAFDKNGVPGRRVGA